jgi:LysM repeat protein
MTFLRMSDFPAIVFFFSAASLFASPVDSVGVEKKGNKTLVLYKVSSGETLTSIARRYRTSISEIVAENDFADQKLKVDQIIKVPYQAPKTLKANPIATQKNAATHTVKPGESLYKIALLYKTTIAELRRLNQLTDDKVKPGQILIVGQMAESKQKEVPKKETIAVVTKTENKTTEGKKVHIVKTGEGLFRVAQTYKVSVDDLKKWNNLDSDEISIGQELLIEAPAYKTETMIAKVEKEMTVKETPVVEKTTSEKKEIEKETIKKDPPAKAENEPVKKTEKEEKKEEKKAEKEEKNQNNYVIKNEGGYEKRIETGMAESIDDAASNDMFLALHRSVPVGTIIQVRNLNNDLSVFVKVVGKLPDTGDNDKLVVKITKRAYDRLAAIDKRFRVEVSYIP